MPASQLRGFLISLVSALALLLAGGVSPKEASARAPKNIASTKRESTKAAKKATQKPSVAILYFDYSGSDEEMGFLRKGLTQMLVTDLSSDKELQIVERTDLEAILKELKLGRTNKIAPSSRNKIGKLLGARYLVTGGYFMFGKVLRVDAKVIDVERGTTTSVGVQENPNDFMSLETQLAAKLSAELRRVQKLRPKTVAHTKRLRRRGPKHSALDAPSRGSSTPMPAARKVGARIVARYGKALDAMDGGHKKVALRELGAITKNSPQFKIAASDLRNLLRY